MLIFLPSPVVKGPEREADPLALSRVLWLRRIGAVHPRPMCPSLLAQGQLSFTFNSSLHYPQCQGVINDLHFNILMSSFAMRGLFI